MFGLKDLVAKFSFCFRGQKDGHLCTSGLSTHAHAKILFGSQEFYKKGDKFDWVKYWQMTFDLPKFSPTTILCYMIYLQKMLIFGSLVTFLLNIPVFITSAL